MAELAAQNLPDLPDNTPVDVTTGQSGGVQTRMTLRQTFTGRHSYRGRHQHAHLLPRRGQLAVSNGVRETAVAGANGQPKQSAPDVLVTKVCSDMAINTEQPAAEQEASTKAVILVNETPDSPHSMNSAMGSRRKQVSNTNGRE